MSRTIPPLRPSQSNDAGALEINYSEGLYVGYRGYEKNRIKPQYPFGYGLSYTTFRYSDIEVESLCPKEERPDEGATILFG